MKGAAGMPDDLTETEARALFEEYRHLFIRCFEEAWDEYNDGGQYSTEQRAKHSKRTKASVVNDLMIHRAYVVFRNVSGVQFVVKHGYHHLSIRDRALVRLKKLDKQGRPSNIQTERVKNLNSPNTKIDGLPTRARRLVAGYQENGVGGLMAIFIVAPVGRKIEYRIPVKIYGQQDDLFPVIPEITPTPISGDGTIVKLKPEHEPKKDKLSEEE